VEYFNHRGTQRRHRGKGETTETRRVLRVTEKRRIIFFMIKAQVILTRGTWLTLAREGVI
jgi:hypothetical protein